MKYRLASNETEYQRTTLQHYFFIPLVWVFKDYPRLLKLIIPHPYKRLFTNSIVTLPLSPGRGVWGEGWTGFHFLFQPTESLGIVC